MTVGDVFIISRCATIVIEETDNVFDIKEECIFDSTGDRMDGALRRAIGTLNVKGIKPDSDGGRKYLKIYV